MSDNKVKICERQVVAMGVSSKAVTIPSDKVKEFGIEVGDAVDIFSTGNRELTYKFKKPRKAKKE